MSKVKLLQRRVYDLLRTSRAILMVEGPAAFLNRLWRWLRGERRYHSRPVFNISIPASKVLPQTKDKLGLNFVGDLQADVGLGDSSRALVKAALQRNIAVSYIEVSQPHIWRTTPRPAGLTQGHYYDITLIHLNADDIFWGQLTPQSLPRQYIIGYWYWEFPNLPDGWLPIFQLVQEVWVATDFVLNIFGRAAPVPVVKIPPAIEVQTTPARRSEFGLSDNSFIFTFSFSPISFMGRKNPLGLIEAFRRAFGRATSGPLLVIKTQYHGSSTLNIKQLMRKEIAKVNGCLFDQAFSRQEMFNFLNLSDCYISLHRVEGLGLGIAESMALGKPVIATAYSGNTDFMTPENSYGVNYRLREIGPQDYQYQPEFISIYEPGQLWAEPDLDHAAELMTRVYENPEEARQVGENARKFIAAHYNSAAQGAAIEKRLQEIVKNRE